MNGVSIPAGEDDPFDGGLNIEEWMQLWNATHHVDGMGSIVRDEWPDGRPFIEQPNLVVTMMRTLSEEFTKSCQTTSSN